MKKLFTGFLIALVVLLPSVVSANTPVHWDLTGTYTIDFVCTSGCSGTWTHIMNITNMDMDTGAFSGTGYYNPSTPTWTVTGNILDCSNINFTIDYDSSAYYVDVVGTISDDGSMSGTWNNPTQAGYWETTSGAAIYIADEYVSGGGQMIEESEGNYKDWYKISFGGRIWKVCSGGIMGEWEINFHNVGDDEYDKSKFHTTSITDLNFYADGTCVAMNFTAYGEFNQIPGYKIIFRAGDSGEPGIYDTVRVHLFDPNGVEIYDTSDGDFNDESDCFGDQRTRLDNGNIKIEF